MVAALATTVTALSLLIAVPAIATAAPKPPPNPTNGQISAAQQAKDSLANRVGELSGQIAEARIELQHLANRVELAQQKAALAYSKLQIANQAAARAKTEVRQAAAEVDHAHARFVDYVQAAYMSGGIDGTGGTLLTADDPNALLEQSALEQYQQAHQADAIGALQQATVGKSNADARARNAVSQRKAAAADAKTQAEVAARAYAAQKAQAAALEQTIKTSQAELDAAQSRLADLNNQRAAYLAYKAEQARLARIRAERERRQREAAAAAAAAARAAARNHGSGGGGGSSGGWSTGGSAPSGGSWTATKGRRAADRALSQQGVPYAWGGGGADGKSQGYCVPSAGAPDDCNFVGFDCSGLAMYAWGRNWNHLASDQYRQAGHYHPPLNKLKPGDLLFWSDGGESSIHHVAIYIGNQEIVQAPQSYDVVRVTSMWAPGPIWGTTRPLT
jgi:cell wall-associated NlpC family hydrolase